MRTIRLSVSENAYQKLKVIFSLFGEKDLHVEEDSDYVAHKSHLEKELSEIERGDAKFISIDEAERQLDEVIDQHESRV